MQAVILAAGKSTRTYPLTLTRPKPLLPIANKPLLAHTLDRLQGIVEEVILVVGYKQQQIRKKFGSKYKKIKIKYAVQRQQLGTAHALLKAKHLIKGKFLLLMGDDLYAKEDFKKMSKHDFALLTTKVPNPWNFGVVVAKRGLLYDFKEKPKKFISNKISTACYTLDKTVFTYMNRLKKTTRGEYELPDALLLLSKDHPVNIISAGSWIPIGFPWDLLTADQKLRKKKNNIGKGTKITGKVSNSSIGSNCLIEGTVKNSVIMDHVHILPGSIIDSSVIGNNSKISGKLPAKNNTISIVKNKKIKVKRMGSIVADNVTAEKVIIKPGCKINPNKKVKGRIIKDVM